MKAKVMHREIFQFHKILRGKGPLSSYLRIFVDIEQKNRLFLIKIDSLLRKNDGLLRTILLKLSLFSGNNASELIHSFHPLKYA